MLTKQVYNKVKPLLKSYSLKEGKEKDSFSVKLRLKSPKAEITTLTFKWVNNGFFIVTPKHPKHIDVTGKFLRDMMRDKALEDVAEEVVRKVLRGHGMSVQSARTDSSKFIQLYSSINKKHDGLFCFQPHDEWDSFYDADRDFPKLVEKLTEAIREIKATPSGRRLLTLLRMRGAHVWFRAVKGDNWRALGRGKELEKKKANNWKGYIMVGGHNHWSGAPYLINARIDQPKIESYRSVEKRNNAFVAIEVNTPARYVFSIHLFHELVHILHDAESHGLQRAMLNETGDPVWQDKEEKYTITGIRKQGENWVKRDIHENAYRKDLKSLPKASYLGSDPDYNTPEGKQLARLLLS